MDQNKNTLSDINLSLSDPVRALSDCTLCPRNCHVNRLQGQRGFCGESGVLRAARAALYYTEEPVISGKNGSGTVFFSGCNLGCIYCQNRQISRPGRKISLSDRQISRPGRKISHSDRQTSPPDRESCKESLPRLIELSPERLAEIFFELEEQGAHNINLVTPEHFVPLLIPALRRAKAQGLSIPIVYNTGSYEKAEAVRALEGLVDVWLPDLKYVSSALSARHTGAADYFSCASAAIAEMVRQCPEPVFSDGSHAIDCPDDADDPLMVHGVLVRHLALPGCAEDSRAVLRYLHETYGDRIFISILNQYTPMPQVFAGRNTPRLRHESPLTASPLHDAAPAEYTQTDPEASAQTNALKDAKKSAQSNTRTDPEASAQTNALTDAETDPGPGSCVESAPADPDLCRRLSVKEYDALIDYAIDLGIQNGFIQESGTVSPSYIPVFDGTGIE